MDKKRREPRVKKDVEKTTQEDSRKKRSRNGRGKDKILLENIRSEAEEVVREKRKEEITILKTKSEHERKKEER